MRKQSHKIGGCEASHVRSRVPFLLRINNIRLVSTDGEKGCVIQFKDLEEIYVEENIDTMELLLRGTNGQYNLPPYSHEAALPHLRRNF